MIRAVQELRRRSRAGERGATLIEGAIMLPLFFLLVFGVFEFGFSFRNYLTLANGTRDGARTGSTAGHMASADFQILQAVERSMSAMDADDIQQIVVFHASGPEATVPSACTPLGAPGSASAQCNVYTTADFELGATDFDCSGSSPDRFWCPVSRKTAVRGANGPPDYLGVWIQVKYDFITGLFPGGGMTFEDTTIMRLEPRTIE